MNRIVDIQALDSRTALVYESPGGLTTISIPFVWTACKAQGWRRVMRVDRIEIEINGEYVGAAIIGVSHRIPRRRVVPVSVALALLAEGVRGRVAIGGAG